MRRAAVVACALAATTAHADPERSRQLDAEAQALAGKGDFIGAAAKFRDAYAAEARPELVCNAGVAYFKGSDWPRAHRYLNQCLSIGAALDASFVTNARKVLDSIVKKLASGSFTPVDFAVTPGIASITISHAGGGAASPFDEPIVGPRRVYLPFGRYRAVLHAEGHVDRTVEIDAAKRDALVVNATLERAPSGVSETPPRTDPPPRSSSPAPRTSSTPPEAPPGHDLTQQRPSKVPAIVVSTIAVGAGVTAFGFYWVARSEVDAAEAALEMPEFQRHRDRAKRFHTTSLVVGGIAGVGAAASAYLWYRATRAPVTAEVTATGNGATVSIGGRF